MSKNLVIRKKLHIFTIELRLKNVFGVACRQTSYFSVLNVEKYGNTFQHFFFGGSFMYFLSFKINKVL